MNRDVSGPRVVVVVVLGFLGLVFVPSTPVHWVELAFRGAHPERVYGDLDPAFVSSLTVEDLSESELERAEWHEAVGEREIVRVGLGGEPGPFAPMWLKALAGWLGFSVWLWALMMGGYWASRERPTRKGVSTTAWFDLLALGIVPVLGLPDPVGFWVGGLWFFVFVVFGEAVRERVLKLWKRDPTGFCVGAILGLLALGALGYVGHAALGGRSVPRAKQQAVKATEEQASPTPAPTAASAPRETASSLDDFTMAELEEMAGVRRRDPAEAPRQGGAPLIEAMSRAAGLSAPGESEDGLKNCITGMPPDPALESNKRGVVKMGPPLQDGDTSLQPRE